MILKQIYINREEYGSDKGKCKGTITFKGTLGEVQITLTPQQVDRIFNVFADSLIEAATEAASTMKQSLEAQREANSFNLLTKQEPQVTETEEDTLY